jgi:hypothetical protein
MSGSTKLKVIAKAHAMASSTRRRPRCRVDRRMATATTAPTAQHAAMTSPVGAAGTANRTEPMAAPSGSCSPNGNPGAPAAQESASAP